MNLLNTERELYEDVWTSVESYSRHSPGEFYVPMFLRMVGEDRYSKLVLDAGCGSGKGALALNKEGFDVVMCDVTDVGLLPEAKAGFRFAETSLWDDLRGKVGPVDYVYCTDVLEHIPEQFTMLCIRRMLEVGPLFLSVSLMPDNYGNWVGRPLHQTVKPFVWWRDSLREVGIVREARDLINNAVFFVEER